MARKQATEEPVPPMPGEDAVERKRVLNILAQRRYRKRKKERMQALESRANGPELSGVLLSDQQGRHPSRDNSRTTVGSQDVLKPLDQNGHCTASSDPYVANTPNLDLTYFDAQVNVSFQNDESYAAFQSASWPDTRDLHPVSLSASGLLELPPSLALPTTSSSDASWAQLAGCSDWIGQTQVLDDIDKQLAEDLPTSTENTYDLSAELQADDTSFFTFPDDRILAVPSLTLLNAAMKVAQRLGINGLIWDFTAVSPFYTGDQSHTSISSPPSLETGLSTSATSPANSVDLTELPSHLLPTPTQRLIPHHPIIDLLPWPSTRDKLIHVFHLPPNLRPPNAQDPMGLLRLVYDMEDGGGEGMRISGDDPFEPCVWEIGQVVFERWWWAFETSVVERSNRARGNRGERILALESHK
ncbi:uncharacterized protein N7482_002941 [Penicillium canariense]|uniref:BZIP domain-containing protein n=1 Tax=Penicillium canariense TaxID=189055 RepID=A0A9W9LVB2_9EURO|nr:uncharacterized protein N7482_002941 [Penicillium canariense]KAJ5177064.1 hypothetical protein N7482_002941 [Penicillium canariense]